MLSNIVELIKSSKASSAQLHITTESDGGVSVVVMLGDIDEEAINDHADKDCIEPLLNALRNGLLVKGNVDEVEKHLVSEINKFGAVCKEMVGAIESNIGSIAAAAAEAKKTAEKNKKKVADKKGVTGGITKKVVSAPIVSDKDDEGEDDDEKSSTTTVSSETVVNTAPVEVAVKQESFLDM